MPQCVKCRSWFHPDWLMETEIRGDQVITCLFCHLDKKELTIEDDKGKIIEVISKEQANKVYIQFLENIAKRNATIKTVIQG